MLRFAIALLAAGLCQGAVHYVTVAGYGHEQDYEQRFAGWAKEIDKILRGSGGGDSQVTTLSAEGATRAKMSETLAEAAKSAKADDTFVLMLIGHGTFDGAEYKFNLRGPDIGGIELAALLDRIPAGRQLVVNMTSSSGGSVSALQRPNRVVIAATKTGTEKNATVFARYWVEALRDPGADQDKNESISALEAYLYADKKTTGFYETQKRIATEHAVIEDTGQGAGVRAPAPAAENGQGQAASRFALLRIGSAQRAASDPAKRELLARKEAVEQQIDKLKYEKAAMPTEVYRKQISALLLELARLQQELDK